MSERERERETGGPLQAIEKFFFGMQSEDSANLEHTRPAQRSQHDPESCRGACLTQTFEPEFGANRVPGETYFAHWDEYYNFVRLAGATCEPVECGNCLVCDRKAPQRLLDAHNGLCRPCNFAFGRALARREEHDEECGICMDSGVPYTAVQLTNCVHFVCPSCFRAIHSIRVGQPVYPEGDEWDILANQLDELWDADLSREDLREVYKAHPALMRKLFEAFAACSPTQRAKHVFSDVLDVTFETSQESIGNAPTCPFCRRDPAPPAWQH